jgi:hypothetical protein
MYPIQNARYINIVQFISDPSKEGTPLIGPAVLSVTEEDDVASIYAGWEDDVQCVVKVCCVGWHLLESQVYRVLILSDEAYKQAI